MKIRFIYPFLFLIFPIFIAAGTTGKIKGLVLDKETNSTIIGANSLVNKSLPENSKAYGIPAKLIKSQDAL